MGLATFWAIFGQTHLVTLVLILENPSPDSSGYWRVSLYSKLQLCAIFSKWIPSNWIFALGRIFQIFQRNKKTG
jgi:hypothetical protein